MVDLFNTGLYTMVLVENNKTTLSKTCATIEDAKRVMYKVMQRKGYEVADSFNDYQSRTYICNNKAEFHINRI